MVKVREIAGYKVLQQIGLGAASTLYAVTDPKTRQIYALKHVPRLTDKDQRFIDQVVNEYDVASKLDHPRVRSVVKLVRHRKMFKTMGASLIMELVDALPLDERPPRSQIEAVQIFIETAGGLAHMHGRGFVHADIKPNNVLISDREHVKIIDLGQACRIGTVKQRIQGTPGYMAPEQAHRQAITPQTDIYNLGAMMYFMLCNKTIPNAMPPKDADSGGLYSGAVDTEMLKPPVPPVEINPEIHALLSKQIMDCVELDPQDRPESMQVVINRLELIQDLLQHDPDDMPPIVDDETTV